MNTEPGKRMNHNEIQRIRELMRSHPKGTNRSANEVALDHSSRGERYADTITRVLGSWKFIIIQSSLLGLWLLLNSIGWYFNWDPYPFILLNLVLSFQAAFTAPIIMMSQNRQSSRDRIASELDFEINRKAAGEVNVIQQKLDELTSRQWDTLLDMLAEHQETLRVMNERTAHIERVIQDSRDSENPV